MNLRIAARVLSVAFLLSASAASADLLDKLPRDVRIQFVESLGIVNGKVATGRIDGVKRVLSAAEWQQFKAMMGWGHLGVDHEGYCCFKAGDCIQCTGHICDPSKCTGNSVTLGSFARMLSPTERMEFLMSFHFANGRAVTLPGARLRRGLTQAEVAEIEKLQR